MSAGAVRPFFNQPVYALTSSRASGLRAVQLKTVRAQSNFSTNL
jgi:hypothetical protein